MIKLMLGLSIVMVVNILLGSSLAKIKEEFKSKKLLNGLYKAGVVFASVLLLYVCGQYNSDLVVVNINGIDFNLKVAMELLCKSVIVFYGAKDFNKLVEIFGVKVNDTKNIIKLERSDFSEEK